MSAKHLQHVLLCIVCAYTVSLYQMIIAVHQLADVSLVFVDWFYNNPYDLLLPVQGLAVSCKLSCNTSSIEP